MKKLELKNLKVKKLTKNEQENVKGGLVNAFTSIGHHCSVVNHCTRLTDQSAAYCSDAMICYYD